MDHREYIEKYLAAQADGELNAEERRAAGAHLTGCPQCRALLAEQRALKALLKDRLGKAKAPAELEAAVRATLNRADAAASMRGDLRVIASAAARRPKIWGPAVAALAAVLLLMVMTRGNRTLQAPTADFDVAIAKFTAFENHFEPNVPSDSAASVARHYHSMRMPAGIWNFDSYGYHLVGGRLEDLPDRRSAEFTFYRGSKGAVMCTRFEVPWKAIPPGGLLIANNQYAYSYRGFSLVLSVDPESQWICILMSRLPMPEFSRDVLTIEGAA